MQTASVLIMVGQVREHSNAHIPCTVMKRELTQPPSGVVNGPYVLSTLSRPLCAQYIEQAYNNSESLKMDSKYKPRISKQFLCLRFRKVRHSKLRIGKNSADLQMLDPGDALWRKSGCRIIAFVAMSMLRAPVLCI